MSDSLHDLRLGPAPVSDAEQARRRNRFVERFMAQMDEADSNPQWQVPKDAKEAYRNIADDWAIAYHEQAKLLRDCRERLAAILDARDQQAVHEACNVARDWLAAHPAKGG